MIDTSITPTEDQPHGTSTHALANNPATPLAKAVQPGVDEEAHWVKKGGQLAYGYKRHYLSSADSVLLVQAANVGDGQCIGACLDQVALAAGSRLLADQGYGATKNSALLCAMGLRSGIHKTWAFARVGKVLQLVYWS